MALPNSYTQKPGAIPAYFEAILNAQAPERFTTRFLENLGFKSTNDRLFMSILKDLGFLDTDSVPTERYYRFHDRSHWERVLAEGIREAYADLYKVNQRAHEMSSDDVNNKLRTLFAGAKSDQVIGRIAKTFTALCEIADFSEGPRSELAFAEAVEQTNGQPVARVDAEHSPSIQPRDQATQVSSTGVSLDSLQYHINIVLPESRDQAVYDAIFRSLKDHLGR